MFVSLMISLFWFLLIAAGAVAAFWFFKSSFFKRVINPKERIVLPDGQILEGPEEILGKGGFGVVAKYSLTNGTNQSLVAVKIPNSMANNAEQEREIAMLRAAGSHANIIKYITSATVKHKVYVVMELMHGTVSDLLRVYPHLSWKTKLSVVVQMLTGIVHLHALSNGLFTRTALVHQDLKPDNILVDKIEDSEKIQVKISDFGIARMVDEFKVPLLGAVGSLSHAGPAGGTLQYMAPEVVKILRSSTADGCQRESDVFSAGLIMWKVATGKSPGRGSKEISGGSCAAFERDQAHRPNLQKTNLLGATKMVQGKPDYPKSKFFGPVIANCIKPNPSERESASKLLAQVQQIQLS